jgi:A/G-specific adenine glycosylase
MSFENQLVKWYKNNKRDLPWRKNNDPYSVWISEVILQQTRVVQGTKYYNEFLEKFPNIQSLASSKESEVLNVWKGLGYYNRAINLHKSSQYIASNLNGKFPKTYNEIIKLKGVGDYTASAISSICFNEFNPVVDGNVLRLLSRYYGLKTPIDSLKFGSLVCTPFPDCESCVFSSKCVAFNSNEVEKIPVKSKKKKSKERFFNYIIFIDNKNYTMVNKRLNKDIWYKLNEFPLIESKRDIKNIIAFPEFKKFTKSKSIVINEEMYKKEKIKHILSHQILYITFHHFSISQDISQGVHLSKLNKYNFPVPITNFINKLLI